MPHDFPFHPAHILPHSWFCYVQFPSCIIMWADLCVCTGMIASFMHFVCFCPTFRETQGTPLLIPEHADPFLSSETGVSSVHIQVLHLSLISSHSMFFGTSNLFPSVGLVSSAFKWRRPDFVDANAGSPSGLVIAYMSQTKVIYKEF